MLFIERGLFCHKVNLANAVVQFSSYSLFTFIISQSPPRGKSGLFRSFSVIITGLLHVTGRVLFRHNANLTFIVMVDFMKRYFLFLYMHM